MPMKFKIEIEGIKIDPVQEISGLESFNEVNEWGKKPGDTHYPNIIMRHQITESPKLFEWYQGVTKGDFTRKNGSIMILGHDGDEFLRFNFFDAWPCRWAIRLTDSGERLMEEVELVIDRFEQA